MPLTTQSLKTYLDAILSPPPNRPPWHGGAEFYTPTQALPLKAQFSQAQPKEQKAKQPDDRQEQKQEAVDVLEGLGKYALEETGHVLLIGKPGSGKSTALQQLLRKTAKDALDGLHRAGTSSIPVLIELRGVSPQPDVWLWIKAAFEAKGVTVEVGVLKSQKLLLLFDGLDEVAPAVLQALDQFLGYHNVAKMPVVCTTRQLGAGADLGIQKRLELLPLSEGQMRQFVAQRFRDEPMQAEMLLRQLQDRLRELAETPLLLQMLCDVCAERGEIPANRGELFKREFSQRYARFKKASTRPNQESSLRDLLMHLAGTMMQGEAEQPTIPVLQLSRAKAQRLIEEFLQAKGETSRWTAATEYLRDLLSSHLLQESTEPDYIKFHHRLFQEYYAAEWLCGQLESSRITYKELQCHYLNYLKWTEVFSLVTELLPNDNQVMQIISLALEVDLRLGARLVGKVQPKLQQQAIDLLDTVKIPDNLEMPVWLKVELLGQTCSEKAVPKLLEMFCPEVADDIGWKVIEALENTMSKSAIPALLKVITLCDDEYDQKCAVKALLNIGSSFAIDGIVKALSSKEDVEEKMVFIEALYDIEIIKSNNSETVPALLKATKHSDLFVSCFSIMAMGLTDSRDSISELLWTLKAKETEIRYEGIQTLTKLGGAEVVAALLTVLEEDQNAGGRQCAAEALGRLGDAKIVPGLIRALDDPDEQVSKEVVDTLSKLDCQEFTDLLITALSHPNARVRLGAVTGLRNSARKDVVSLLLKALQDSDEEVGDEASKVLAKVAGTEIVPELLDLLKHHSVVVRWQAVRLLGYLGNEQVFYTLLDLLDELLPSLPEYDRDLIRQTIYAVGGLAEKVLVLPSPKILEMIHQKLENEQDEWLRVELVELIGELGAEDSILVLLNSLMEDSNWNVRESAIKSLTQIGGDKIINPLKRGLLNENDAIRLITAKALIELGLLQEAIPCLIALLEDLCPPKVREKAAEILADLKVEKAVPKLLEALENPVEIRQYYSIRQDRRYYLWCAAKELAKIGSNEAVNALLEAVKSPDKDVRFQVVNALSLLKDDRVINVLLKALEDEEPDVRHRVSTNLEELENINTCKILPDLVRLIPTPFGRNAFDTILAIQAKCQFYNYEIYKQAKFVGEEREEKRILGGGNVYIESAEVIQIIESNQGNVVGKMVIKRDL
jgi:HEAT repeat protein/energy-coupling factor transporter ATP-binding protein EcfA2